MTRYRTEYVAYAEAGNVTSQKYIDTIHRAGHDKVVWDKARTNYSEEAIASKLRQAYEQGKRDLRDEIKEAMKG